MDYEQKYKDALERASHIKDNNTVATPQEVAEHIFPELTESENERIRKWLISYVGNCPNENFEFYGGVGKDAVLAWLEKQKEQKTIKWTELTWEDIIILEGMINNVHYEFRNGIGQESFGKEVLEKFRDYKGDECSDEQKPAEWSENDEKILSDIDELLYDAPWSDKEIEEHRIWLKSLRPSWKPSEEQMRFLCAVVNDPNNAGAESCYMALKSLYNDLKKL